MGFQKSEGVCVRARVRVCVCTLMNVCVCVCVLYAWVFAYMYIPSGGLVLGYYGNEFTRDGLLGISSSVKSANGTVSQANTRVS